MPKKNLAWTAIAAGVIATGLLGACASDAKAPCAGDDCDTENQSSNEAVHNADAGHAASSGSSKTSGSKVDAGVPKSSAPAAAKPDASVTSAGGKLPCDVAKIVDKYCSTCHGMSPAFGAPMSLTGVADFEAPAKSDPTKLVSSLTSTRVNATVANKKMPPASAPQPTATERATLTAWVKAGTPAGTESCAVASAPDAGSAGHTGESLPQPAADPSLTCYKLLSNDGRGGKFAVGVARDAYFNVVLAAPWKGTVYARVISPVIDNMKAIHHWLLFQDSTPGVPAAPVSSSGAHPGGQLMFGWAPGGEPMDLRTRAADIGMELPGNTTYTLEFHYNSDDAAALDASGAEICVTTEKPENVIAESWLGYDNLLVPSTSWTGTCAPSSKEPIHIIQVTPHMHLSGTHMKGVINRKDGTTEILSDEDFDFNYQVSYPKDVTLMPGDTITTTCTFSTPQSFGESTTAEMCYLFTLAYPQGALADGQVWGSTAHGGSSCLGQ